MHLCAQCWLEHICADRIPSAVYMPCIVHIQQDWQAPTNSIDAQLPGTCVKATTGASIPSSLSSLHWCFAIVWWRKFFSLHRYFAVVWRPHDQLNLQSFSWYTAPHDLIDNSHTTASVSSKHIFGLHWDPCDDLTYMYCAQIHWCRGSSLIWEVICQFATCTAAHKRHTCILLSAQHA